MNWNQILITFLTACVPSLITYFANRYQSKNEIAKLKEQHQHEYQMLKETTQSQIDVLKAKAETSSQTDLTNSTANFMFDIFGKMMTGEINPDNLKKLENLGK